MLEVRLQPQADAFLGALAALRGGYVPPLEDALRSGRELVAREARRAAPQAEQDLLRGIVTTQTATLQHEVQSTADHGGYVEFGTGLQGPLKRWPGHQLLPDEGIARIANWIRRKGITPRDYRIDPEQLPWLIARKIALQGTRPQPYLMPAATAQAPMVFQLIGGALERAFSRVGLGLA